MGQTKRLIRWKKSVIIILNAYWLYLQTSNLACRYNINKPKSVLEISFVSHELQNIPIDWNYEIRCDQKINLLTPNVNYSGRTAPLTSKVVFYIFIQQI